MCDGNFDGQKFLTEAQSSQISKNIFDEMGKFLIESIKNSD